ncbi:MAG TPA: ScyD/ScyE family protein [Baekduia sp.]|nr:ScyD/ScyE family protein [Baekduia sp.]
MKRSTAVLAISAAVTATALGAAPAPAATPSASVTPVITGLNAPRGLAFDTHGSLYVAESGRWQGTIGPQGPTGEGVTQTGAVTRYAARQRGHGGSAPAFTPIWRTALTSLYDSENGPEVLGPEGVAATGRDCLAHPRHHHGHHALRRLHHPGLHTGRCSALTIMSESRDGFAAGHPGEPVPQQLGQLLALDARTGRVRGSLSDVGGQQYAFTGAHPELDPGGQYPDANPYGVLVTRHATYVVDAGANTVSVVSRSGRTRVLAYIPNDAVSDAAPTCVAQGPDGALYVGALNFLLNSDLSTTPPGIGENPGHSDVWRIDPRTHEDYLHAAHRWATGLTTITACTFDRHGDFWAAEMFQPNAGGPPGDLARVPFAHPTTVERVGGGQLPLPGGVAQGRDGALYVTTGSADTTPDAGAVARVALGG